MGEMVEEVDTSFYVETQIYGHSLRLNSNEVFLQATENMEVKTEVLELKVKISLLMYRLVL